MKKLTLALLLSATVTASAFAADEGFYGGVTVGRSRTSDLSGVALNKSSDTVGGILGGYQFTKNWGVEAQYTSAGKFEAGTASGKGTAYGISGVGTLPINDQISLYGKLGFASVKTTLSNAGGSSGATRTAPTYGFGAQYNLTPAVGLRMGWDRYAAAINNGAGSKTKFHDSSWTIGAVYKF